MFVILYFLLVALVPTYVVHWKIISVVFNVLTLIIINKYFLDYADFYIYCSNES